MYSHFGLDTKKITDDIYEKAEQIARKTSLDQAQNVPEITLVDAYGNATTYNYYKDGELVGDYTTGLRQLSNGLIDVMGQESNTIRNLSQTEHGVSRKLYNSALSYGDRYFNKLYGDKYKGIISGELLLSPEQTMSVISKPNFSTEVIGN